MEKTWYHLLSLIFIGIGGISFVACRSDVSSPSPQTSLVTEVMDITVTEEQTFLNETETVVSPLITNTAEFVPTLVPPPHDAELTSDPLPPKPMEVEFVSEDGFIHTGRYFPSAVNPSSMIVLMHWAPGDLEDWNEIAFWLQNRGLSGSSLNLGQEPWLDPTWFPPMIEGKSFGVFSFSFRECEGGCRNFTNNRPLWLLDAKAALKTAMELDGVDPNQLLVIGASIGADGAVDGCYLHNDLYPNSCLGALSLSPGDYLTISYPDAIMELMQEDPPKPVWCFCSSGDASAAQACKAADGEHYLSVEWSGSSHGMDLIRPGITPNVLLEILKFITAVLELS